MWNTLPNEIIALIMQHYLTLRLDYLYGLVKRYKKSEHYLILMHQSHQRKRQRRGEGDAFSDDDYGISSGEDSQDHLWDPFSSSNEDFEHEMIREFIHLEGTYRWPHERHD